MSIKSGFLLPCAMVWGLILLPLAACAGEKDLSDAAKKEAVDRMYADYKQDFPNVADISPSKAMAQLDRGGVVFVDIRKPEEMAVSRLPDAISKQAFLDHRQRYADKTVIVYCTIGYRSGVFARDMRAQGIEVINLRGSILAWVLEGGTVYDEQDIPSRRVHVYGDKWDYAPAGWESVKFNLLQQVF